VPCFYTKETSKVHKKADMNGKNVLKNYNNQFNNKKINRLYFSKNRLVSLFYEFRVECLEFRV
jgi:hypothetical protein